MFRAILATAAVGLVTALTASAGAIEIGGPSGLTSNYITQGSGSVCAAGVGNCVAGSLGGWAEKNYINALFSGATNGAAPVPFTGYVQNGGVASGLTMTSAGGNTSAAGVNFAMISDGGAGPQGTGASKDLWEASAANTSIVVPIGVYDVTDVATMLQNVWGSVGGNDTSITFNFGGSSSAMTDLTSVTFNLFDVNNQTGQNASGVIRAGVACTTTTTVACDMSTNPSNLPLTTSSVLASDGNTYTINTSAVYGSTKTGGQYLYTSAGSGLYSGTVGQLKMDDQDFVFGSAFANDWLVSVAVTQNSNFGNNISATALSAITVDSAAPEPTTVVLLFAGLGSIAAMRRFRKAKA